MKKNWSNIDQVKYNTCTYSRFLLLPFPNQFHQSPLCMVQVLGVYPRCIGRDYLQWFKWKDGVVDLSAPWWQANKVRKLLFNYRSLTSVRKYWYFFSLCITYLECSLKFTNPWLFTWDVQALVFERHGVNSFLPGRELDVIKTGW